MPDPDPDNGEWEVLGSVTIDTGTLLLIDPVHNGTDVGELSESDHTQIAIPDGDFSDVLVATGMGNGRYAVEGRHTDCLAGRRIAEIRIRFLGETEEHLGFDRTK